MLRVLGKSSLQHELKAHNLERRVAALLCYLILKGSTPRAKLAALLWPDSDDRTARNNLVQTLKRLKKTTGEDFVVGNDSLKLSDSLESDIVKINILFFQGYYQELLSFSGDLLPYDYDDIPEFSDWLFLERDKLANLRREALLKVIEKLEQDGDYSTALSYATNLLHLDPMSEEAYRLLMRLYYLLGNRTEALRTFERCKTVLQIELGVKPLLETQQLAADIGIGLLEPSPARQQRVTLPLSILRPPVLVGREKEWEALETAWQDKKVIFISGEPGVGKTRLIQDFMADKGAHHFFGGRPGDENVLLSSMARAMRHLFESQPELNLEPWIHTELSRLVPHLSKEPAAPITSDGDKLRFYDALAETLLRSGEWGTRAIVWDDLQYFDAASLELGQYALSRVSSKDNVMPIISINLFRKGELSLQVSTALEQMVAHDQAVLIEVQPLEEAQVASFLSALNIASLESMSAALMRYTGGNLMFILETLKSLLESNQLAQGLPSHLPVSGKVTAVIQKRLDSLSIDALKLARVAAVAGTDFTPQLAENVLNMDALELAEPFAELERMQVFRDTAFAHDLIYEATLAGLPTPVKSLLHKRVATWLEGTKAYPARIAQHYLEAGEEAMTAPFLLQAAKVAQSQYLFIEAADYFKRAGQIYDQLGDRGAIFAAYYQYAEIVVEVDTATAKTILEKLETFVYKPEQTAKLLHLYCKYHTFVGEVALLESTAREGLELAADDSQRSNFLFHIGHTLWLQNLPQKSIPYLEQSLALRQKQRDFVGVAEVTMILSGVLFEVNRFSESEEMLKAAEHLYQDLGRELELAKVFNELASNHLKQGYPNKAIGKLLAADAIFKRTTGAGYDHTDVLHALAVCWSYLGEEIKFFNTLEQALSMSVQGHIGFRGSMYLSLGDFYTRMGAFEIAEETFNYALSWSGLPAYFRPTALRRLARLYMYAGRDTSSLIDDVETLVHQAGNPVQDVCALLCLKAQWTEPDEAVFLATRALKLAYTHGFMYQALPALIRSAQALLKLEKPHEGLDAISQANDILKQTELFTYRTELNLTDYHILKALGDNQADIKLEQILTWLLEVANTKVPPEYRESFLTKNPVNKAVLDEAKLVGLELSS